MDDRQKQVLFLKTLREVTQRAQQNGNCITEAELEEAFSDLELDDAQKQQVREYLNKNGIGIGEALPIEEVLSEEEMNHLHEYEEMIRAIRLPSDNIMDAIKLSAMAGEVSSQKQLVEYSLGKVVDIARLYAGQGVFMEDLIGAGNEALLVASAQLAPLEKPDEVDGYLIKPSLTRASRSMMHVFLNGRMVRTYRLYKAIQDGYEDFIVKGRYPMCVLNIHMDPHLLDVDIR